MLAFQLRWPVRIKYLYRRKGVLCQPLWNSKRIITVVFMLDSPFEDEAVKALCLSPLTLANTPLPAETSVRNLAITTTWQGQQDCPIG